MNVFIAGGTGYLGSRLGAELAARGHSVSAVVRPESARKLPVGVRAVPGNALDATSFASEVPAGAVYVHLVGVAHPAPWKEAAFRAIDLVSLRQSVQAARQAGSTKFVFVSVAHPAPAMHAYIRVRQECEEAIAQSGLSHVILRPWYVLGPGHRWPALLRPLYALAEAFEGARNSARRLGLVTVQEMVTALTAAVERETGRRTIIDVPGIRELASGRKTRGSVPRRAW